ncbi:MAG: JAB domain-containing protein [Treponema sp.]
MDTMLLACQLQEITNEKKPTLKEKLFRNNVASLSDEELISILLRSGSPQYSLKKLSKKVLKIIDKSDDIEKDLRKIKGMGDSKISAIIAAFELGRRYHACIYNKIDNSLDILPYLKHYATRKTEHFISISLNGANEIINIRVVSTGTLMNTIVHPREAFADVLIDRAAVVIFAHNHPSGNVEPSIEDIQLTYKLVEVGKILGIEVIDHIIFSQRNNYTSFAEKGMIKPNKNL